MQDKRKSLLPSPRLLVIAAVAGMIAGAAAVYMKGMGSGNGEDVADAEIDCSAASEKAALVKPFAKGEVAALSVPARSAALKMGDFTGPDGKVISLGALSGRTRLVNLWATWCVPCREEMPALNALQKAFAGKSFEVVAVNIDTGDDEKPKAFLEEIGIDALAFYRDGTMASFNAMKKQGLAFGLPVTVLVDAKGCMLGSMNGPAKWDSEDARKLIEAAL